MNTGDQPAFPSIQQTPFKPGYIPNESAIPGMSYRLWLIGQIASGNMDSALSNSSNPPAYIISFADAILAELDKERGEG
jgi:hypothetical protein